MSVQPSKPSRGIFALLAAATIMLSLPQLAHAQDDNETPLGDVARSLRKRSAVSDTVIDNDNLPQLMEDAETRRSFDSRPLFSLVPAAKSIRVSPDVSCSLSYDANSSTSAASDAFLLDDLPRSELAKLDGPATIDGDSLQVSMHNGTAWELREVYIALTIIRREDTENAARFGQAKIVPALANGSTEKVQDAFQKQPDVTFLLHAKRSAAPSATAIFRTSLNFALFPDQEWHWAIVKAKGIPPQTPPEAAAAQVPDSVQPEPAKLDGTDKPATPLQTPPETALRAVDPFAGVSSVTPKQH